MRKRLVRLLIGFALVLQWACDKDDTISIGSQPTITSVSPSQVFPGQEGVRFSIQGKNLNGIVGVTMGEGITVNKTKVVSSTELTVRFTVSPDARSGSRDVQLATARGVVIHRNAFSVSENKPPVASFTISEANPYRGQEITFDATASSDVDGKIASYAWDFGDGNQAKGPVVQYTYSTSGTFRVSLTVSDERYGKTTKTRDLTVEFRTAPVAHMNVTPTQGYTTTVFRFGGDTSTHSTGKITGYGWDFGDGTTAQGPSVQHKYTQSGVFKVILQVTDSSGMTDEIEKSVQVQGLPPVAHFTITPDFGTVQTDFTFNATGSSDPDGTIVLYEWLIEGHILTGPVVTHRFASEGAHSIGLTVTDNQNAKSSLTKSLTIGTPPPPVSDNCPPPATLINGVKCCYGNKCCEGPPLEKGSIGYCDGRLMCTAGQRGYQPPVPPYDTYPGGPCSAF